ncbi:hypothetical protein [Dactylosporangium darangshiense]|uniref:hypothetical protein n=1 Tax=Dactylosporangium darangshiense TaxID=579108 RepID=UPI003633AC7D
MRLPSILRNESTTVLWVGDERGVSWNPGEGPASTVTLEAVDGDDTYLADLLEALTAMEVFREAAQHTSKMPSRVAVPGVRVVSTRVDDDLLVAAQRRAVGAINGAADRIVPAQPTGERLPRLGGELARRFPRVAPTAPGGTVGQARADAQRAVESLTRTVATAGRPWRPLVPESGAPVPTLFARAAEALRQYREAVRGLLIEGDAGPDGHRRSRLRDLGIALPPGPGPDADEPASAVEAVRREVVAGIEAGRPLKTLVLEVFAAASELRPAGSRVRAADLDRSCPDQQLTKLGEVPPIPGGFQAFTVPLLIFLAPLLALVPALWSPIGRIGAITCGVGVVLLLVFGAALLRGRRRRIGLVRRAALRDTGIVTVVLLLAAVAPAAVAWGVLTGRLPAVGDEPPVPEAFAWGAVGLGAVVALTAIGLWWYLVVRAWRSELATDQPGRLWRAITAVYDAAAEEWTLSETLTSASNAVRAFGGTLDTLGGELEAHAAELRTDPRPGRSARTDVATVGSVNAIVRHDLVGLVLACVERGAADVRLGERDGVAERVGQRARALADAYDRYVRRDGIQNPPADWPDRPGRAQLVSTWWRGLDAFRRAIASGRPVQQLCSDDQVQLLSRNPGAAATVAFAPRSARNVLADPAGNEPVDVEAPFTDGRGELVWTAAGTSAGVLHLVPLRTGVEFGQLERDTVRPGEGPSWTSR